jgi:hypothetical protein
MHLSYFKANHLKENCVCVCVRERERENKEERQGKQCVREKSERERGGGVFRQSQAFNTHTHTQIFTSSDPKQPKK